MLAKMFSTFFLAYPLFFHLKKCFYSDFGSSALRLRMEESVVIFSANDRCMIWGRRERTPDIEAL